MIISFSLRIKFRKLPKVEPHSCINKSIDDLNIWTMICINDPEFNDIARTVLDDNNNWETWLTKHIFRAMINYPTAVFLGFDESSQFNFSLIFYIVDIGSNIGPHSLSVAAMEREVVVVDAVYYNLALISMGHKMTNKGDIRIFYNSISDKPGELLYPYLEVVFSMMIKKNQLQFFRLSTRTWQEQRTLSAGRTWSQGDETGVKWWDLLLTQ